MSSILYSRSKKGTKIEMSSNETNVDDARTKIPNIRDETPTVEKVEFKCYDDRFKNRENKIKSSKIYHYSSSSLNKKEMFFLNPLYSLYKKGAVSLAILIFTIFALTLRSSIPLTFGGLLIIGLSIFLITFIDELRSKKYVRSEI